MIRFQIQNNPPTLQNNSFGMWFDPHGKEIFQINDNAYIKEVDGNAHKYVTKPNFMLIPSKL